MELQPAPVAATEPGKGGFSRLRLEAHGCAPNLPHNFQLITPILPLPSGKKDASARLPRSPVHAKQNDASLPHSETDRRRPMNPLRRPAARREGTQASKIDGSTPAELDPGIGGGGGFSYEPDGTLRPGGCAAGGQGAGGGVTAGHGAAGGQGAARGRSADAAWPNSSAAAPTAFLPSVGVLGGGGSMAGGLLDWWTNAAVAAALGPEWLANVLTAATAPASTSIGNHATIGEAEAAEGVPARRRAGRGGRAPRPRAAARAASATVDIDLTDPM